MIDNITISVVIPTIGRDSLHKTLSSVLHQTHPVSEIIVCYDGDDYSLFNEEFTAKYSQYPCVYNINCGPFNGGNNARQTGIENANSKYIALVDDDDDWMPDHISSFFELAEDYLTDDYLLYSSGAVFLVDGLKVGERPKRMKRSDETFSEYIFVKKSFNWELGFIQSSIMIFSRALALKVPFDRELRFHQDIDWLLRVQKSGLNYSYIQNPVKTVFYNSNDESVSKKITSKQSFRWAQKTFLSLDKRAYGDFLLTQTFRFAKKNDGFTTALSVIFKGIYVGRPSVYSISLAFAELFLPQKIRRYLKRMFLS
uniref:glycosyltransferase family 2 protein n=1 Tax=Klebsiella aerogenes TaxID=548 RepID=UPI001F24504C|nr:glycosyltransferase [Klebsiella aerogenes]